MFNKETCKQCGACLSKCPYIEIKPKEAQAEIALMIQGHPTKEILKSCIGCGYCDSICPTQSNPSHLRAEIRQEKIRKIGVTGFGIMSEDVPINFMTLGLEFEKENKLKNLDLSSFVVPSKEVFYLGCAVSYIYSDLIDTALLSHLPIIGGMKFCCGGYVRNQFGEEEAKNKGRQLLQELKKLGVEKMITFCPECDNMIGNVYPKILPEFDIKSINIVQYLFDQYQNGRIEFSVPLNKKVTFHDACAWRKMDPEYHENPRKLLEFMGAEVIEMTHNRKKTICCGTPVEGKNPVRAAEIAEKRVMEAKDTGVDSIVIGCAGCFSLYNKAKEHGLETYHILEMAQMAIGEEPRHRIQEVKSALASNVITAVSENPEILKQRYMIKNGGIKAL